MEMLSNDWEEEEEIHWLACAPPLAAVQAMDARHPLDEEEYRPSFTPSDATNTHDAGALFVEGRSPSPRSSLDGEEQRQSWQKHIPAQTAENTACLDREDNFLEDCFSLPGSSMDGEEEQAWRPPTLAGASGTGRLGAEARDSYRWAPARREGQCSLPTAVAALEPQPASSDKEEGGPRLPGMHGLLDGGKDGVEPGAGLHVAGADARGEGAFGGAGPWLGA